MPAARRGGTPGKPRPARLADRRGSARMPGLAELRMLNFWLVECDGGNVRTGVRRRWPRRVMMAAAIVVVALCGVTARLFVWPPTGMPERVDAIVVLGGQGHRLDYGLQLANENKAPYLVLSEGLPWIPPGECGHRYPTLTVLCFQPSPDTTQGEAESTARLARQYGWRSVVLITTPDQTWRAELRFRRCFRGGVYAVTTPLPAGQWPYAIAYQWAATAKAELTDRRC